MKSADRDMIREFLKNISFQQINKNKDIEQVKNNIISESTEAATNTKDSKMSERDIVKNFLRNIMGK